MAQKVVDGSLSRSVGGGGGGVHIRMQPSDDDPAKEKQKKVVTLGLLPIIPHMHCIHAYTTRLPKRGTLNIFPTK